MNSLMHLLTRYAAADRLRVDAREWLLFLELDPTRASEVLAHLAILAAEDTGIAFTTAAADALRCGAERGNTPRTADPAVVSVTSLGKRLAHAHHRAAGIWSTRLLPQLVQACVLTPTPDPAPHLHGWQIGTVWLPGSATRYPAQTTTRHRHVQRHVRVSLATCQRLAADLAAGRGWQPDPPLIVADNDRPALLIGADDLDTAWARDADVAVTDTAARVTFPEHWPWQTDTAPARLAAARAHVQPARPRPLRLTVRPGPHAGTDRAPTQLPPTRHEHGGGSPFGSTT
jgi:hypothetical protein